VTIPVATMRAADPSRPMVLSTAAAMAAPDGARPFSRNRETMFPSEDPYLSSPVANLASVMAALTIRMPGTSAASPSRESKAVMSPGPGSGSQLAATTFKAPSLPGPTRVT
jgi:hypothetical protein